LKAGEVGKKKKLCQKEEERLSPGCKKGANKIGLKTLVFKLLKLV